MQTSLAQAQGAIAAAITEARQEGYILALLAIERAVYSAENLEELLAWLTRERHHLADLGPSDPLPGG
jgi:hypothetical protein